MDIDDDDDSDRTESYTPPPLDITNDFLNSSSEKENFQPTKEQSIIVLDESFDQINDTKPINTEPTSNSLLYFS